MNGVENNGDVNSCAGSSCVVINYANEMLMNGVENNGDVDSCVGSSHVVNKLC